MKQSFARTAMSGDGGLHASGRWHTRGVRIVYCSSSAALAALELLVHVDPSLAPDDLRLLSIEVPTGLVPATLDPKRLPRSWRDAPPPASVQSIGDQWLQAGSSALLRVPSAIVPSETNVLVNPGHPDARRLRVVSNEPFAYDQRLLREPRSRAPRTSRGM